MRLGLRILPEHGWPRGHCQPQSRARWRLPGAATTWRRKLTRRTPIRGSGKVDRGEFLEHQRQSGVLTLVHPSKSARSGAAALLAAAAFLACSEQDQAAAPVGDSNATLTDASQGAGDAPSPPLAGPDADVFAQADATDATAKADTSLAPGSCLESADCDGKLLACQVWLCKANLCEAIPVALGSPCVDGHLCTVGDTCTGPLSCAGEPKACGDGNECTQDKCAAKDGSCYSLPNFGDCDDGNACTAATACTSGQCGGGVAVDCSDGNPCTADACSPAAGCVHTPVNAPCSDVCYPAAVCAAGDCQLGAALSCDDGNSCTTDTCAVPGGCVHSDSPLPCGIGLCATGICTAGQCQTGPALWAADLPTVNLGDVVNLRVDSSGRARVWATVNTPQAMVFAVDRLGKLAAKWPIGCADVLDLPGGSTVCVATEWQKTNANSESAVVSWRSVEASPYSAPLKKWPLTAQYGAAFMAVFSAGALQTSPGVWLMGWVATDAPSLLEGYCPSSDQSCGKWNALWVIRSDNGVYETITLPKGQNGTKSIGGGATADGGLIVGAYQSGHTTVARFSAGGKVQWLTKIPSLDFHERLVQLANGTIGVIGGQGKSAWLLGSGAEFASAKLFDPYPGYGSAIALAATEDAGFFVARHTAPGVTELRRYDAGRNLLWHRTLVAAEFGYTGQLGVAALASGDSGSVYLVGVRQAPVVKPGSWMSVPWMARLDAFGHGSCAAAGLCAGLQVASCKDGNVCTLDACDPPTGCTWTGHDAACSTGQPCKSAEVCVNGGCSGGAPLACDDGDLCTADSCVPANGCSHTPLAELAPCGSWGVCKGGKCSKP